MRPDIELAGRLSAPPIFLMKRTIRRSFYSRRWLRHRAGGSPDIRPRHAVPRCSGGAYRSIHPAPELLQGVTVPPGPAQVTTQPGDGAAAQPRRPDLQDGSSARAPSSDLASPSRRDPPTPCMEGRFTTSSFQASMRRWMPPTRPPPLRRRLASHQAGGRTSSRASAAKWGGSTSRGWTTSDNGWRLRWRSPPSFCAAFRRGERPDRRVPFKRRSSPGDDRAARHEVPGATGIAIERLDGVFRRNAGRLHCGARRKGRRPPPGSGRLLGLPVRGPRGRRPAALAMVHGGESLPRAGLEFLALPEHGVPSGT
jgi:hypothetical protein